MPSTVLRLKGPEITSQHWLMEALSDSCRGDPLSAHCYAVYYITQESDRTEILLASHGDIESYALIWYGGRFTIQDLYEVHIHNPVKEIIQQISIPPCKRADIHLYNNTSNDIEIIIERFRSLGFKKLHVEEFHDMICDRDNFNPSPLENLAIKLGNEHAPLYKDLELERGIEITIDEAREILKKYAHYGIIIDNILASIAAKYVTLPWIHVIGGVFTRKGI